MKRGVFATGFLVLMAACATSPRSEQTGAPRAKDTVPDKIAAQRAASGNLRLEDEENRWGFEAAREKRDRAKPSSAIIVAPLPPPGTTPDAGIPQGAP
jgi:hypothetical protein